MRQFLPRLPVRSSTMAAVMALFAVVVPSASAQTARGDNVAQASALGSYLAGRVARSGNDSGNAVLYYRNALTREGVAETVVEQAFQMEIIEGNWAEGERLATRVLTNPEAQSPRLAHLFLGLAAFKRGDLKAADASLKLAAGDQIGDLTSILLRSWIKVAENDAAGALALLQNSTPPEWAQYYMRYHRALLADATGRSGEARTNYEQVFKTDARTLRVALAFARHAARAGDMRLARNVLKDHIDRSGGDGHPMARALRDELVDGAQIPLILTAPREGMAEVLYGLGEALSSEGSVAVGTIYLQLALFLEPTAPFALSALASVHEQTKRYDDAIRTYDRIPTGTPLQSVVDIRKALNLNLLDRVEEAKVILDQLAAADRTDIRPLDALGSIMRGHKRHLEAVEYYSRAIALLPAKPEKKHWTYFYARGTMYERLKQWPKAEVDLLKALQLSPDQPLVLNYLGYSWIDQNLNLKRGLQLIEKIGRAHV